MIYYLAAILASIAWSFGSLFSFYPSRRWGSISFNTVRMLFISIIAFFIIGIIYGFSNLLNFSSDHKLIIISAVIGILLGDGCLFALMSRVGPRKTTILFSLSAPLTLILSVIISDVLYSYNDILGVFLVILGVIIAILFRKDYLSNNSNNTKIEPIDNKIYISILLGIASSLFHSVGLLILKEGLLTGINPIIASWWRLFTASICYSFLTIIIYLKKRIYDNVPSKILPKINQINKRLYIHTLINSILGMGIGTTLIVFAASKGKIGIVASLSSMSPVFILPIIWYINKRPPGYKAWMGAILTIIGAALIFN